MPLDSAIQSDKLKFFKYLISGLNSKCLWAIKGWGNAILLNVNVAKVVKTWSQEKPILKFTNFVFARAWGGIGMFAFVFINLGRILTKCAPLPAHSVIWSQGWISFNFLILQFNSYPSSVALQPLVIVFWTGNECCGLHLMDSASQHVVIETGASITPATYQAIRLRVCTTDPVLVQLWRRVDDITYEFRWQTQLSPSSTQTTLTYVVVYMFSCMMKQIFLN